MANEAWWVVPCYNEASRLEPDRLAALVEEGTPEIALLLVDDGSRDDTGARLRELAARRPDRITVLSLERNSGKGEAVRRGMLAALQSGARMVGYFDADLATPPAEIRRLTSILVDRDVDAVLGSRVAVLGRTIARNPVRHYVGRVFASAASVILDLPVYDTQCGAKIFRATTALEAALDDPFSSRWAFDVELLGRLLCAPRDRALRASRIIEEPLYEWRDVRGSKLRTGDFARAGVDLVWIAWDLHRRRRRRETAT